MKCLNRIGVNLGEVDVGDILIYSDCKAFLIIQNKEEYIASQIFNNGSERLGYIDYSDEVLRILINKLSHDFGLPEKIINISDVSISF